MKKILLPLMVVFSTTAYAGSFDENKITDYFSDRAVVVQDLNQEIRLHGGLDRITELAKKNDAHSNYLLGQMYRMGIVYDQDSEIALEYLTTAAQHSSKEAAFVLGMMQLGKDPVISIEESRHNDNLSQGYGWLKVSAEQGYLEAQFFLGQGYMHGSFYARDIDLAMFWLSRASQQGHNQARELREELIFKTKEMKRSFEAVHKKAINGDDAALVELGKMYEEGYIVQRNYEKAFRLYESAAKLGNKKGKKLAVEINRKRLHK